MKKQKESTLSRFEENQLNSHELQLILGGLAEVPPNNKEPLNAPLSSQNNGNGGLPNDWVDTSFQGQQP